MATLLPLLRQFFVQKELNPYLVGGIVRDALLHLNSTDIDLTVDGNALEVGKELSRALDAHYVVLDEPNRMVRLLPRSGPAWQIDLTSRYGSIAKDLARRDYSINAMAIDLTGIEQFDEIQSFNVLDTQNGVEDINNKTIRAISSDIFHHDPIRLLRGIRISYELGFSLENTTKTLMLRDHELITECAPERIREELLRIFDGTNTFEAVGTLKETGILSALIPELSPTYGLEQPSEHTWDVFLHSAHSISTLDYILRFSEWSFQQADILQNIPWDNSIKEYFEKTISPPSTRRILTKIAALLHDIGKPHTRLVNEGKIRFYGHPQEGAKTVLSVLERLRFSHSECKFVETIVREHLRPVQMSTENTSLTKKAVYRFKRDLEQTGIATLYFSLADHLATCGPNLEVNNWNWHVSIVRQLIDEYSKDTSNPISTKLLDGNTLLNELQLKPCKLIGLILEEISEAHADERINSREEALDFARELLRVKYQNKTNAE